MLAVPEYYRCRTPGYRGKEQYGTGKSEFDDIADCVVTMLQVRADKEMYQGKIRA